MVNRAGFALVYSWKLNTVCMVRFAPRLMWQWQSRKLASIRTWPTRADASYCQKKLHFQEVLWIWPFYILTMIGRSGRFKIGNKGWGPSVKICSTESCYAPFCQHSVVAFVELIYVICWNTFWWNFNKNSFCMNAIHSVQVHVISFVSPILRLWIAASVWIDGLK